MTKQNLKKLVLGTVLMSLSICLTACEKTLPSSKSDQTLPSQAVSIRSAHSNWIEEHFQTEIVNIGLEKLGYKIEKPKELNYPAIYLAVANGDLDYSIINYEKSHKKFFENAGGEKKLEKVGVLTPNSVLGFQIDKKTADEYKITYLEQFQDPKIAKQFDSDGDGKANLVGCNPGWFCESIIDHHIKAYGLQDTVEHDRGQYLPLLADTITRYKQGESVLFFAYNPHWISTVLKPGEDVVWLEVSFTSLPKAMGEVTEKDTSINGKNLGFPIDRQRIFANKKFLAANPVAKRWFELVQIPTEDINAESLLIKQGEDSPSDIRRHAQNWVQKNQDLFDRWLMEAGI